MSQPKEMPPPPWQPARRTVRDRHPLTPDDIVDAALGILVNDGAAALNMRALANALGTGPSTIYWHVANKDQLFDLVLDHVIGEFPRPEPDPERWQAQLKDIARGIRAGFLRYRDLAVVAAGRFPIGPNALVFLEGLVAVARAGGLDDRAAAHLTFVLPAYAQSSAGEQHGSAEPTPEQVRVYIESLPADSFPNLIATAPEIAAGDIEDRFEFGLDLLIAGLTAS